MSEITAVIDFDWVCFTAASAGQSTKIVVTHKKSGNVKEFKTRTDFYGHWKKKEGGWLGDLNKKREEEGKPLFSVEDFEIEDVVMPEPLPNVLHTVKRMVERVLEQTEATKLKGFISGGDTYRLDKSTIIEYKGNRKDTEKPLLFEDVREYILKKYSPEVISDVETDDALIMEAYKKPDHVVVAVDKDAKGCPVKVFNPDKPDDGVVDCDCFGELWVDTNSSKTVRGKGRLFLYFQVAWADPVDNYKANSASDKKWGDKGAYKRMSQCTNDKEAWEALVEIYKDLYPEPKTIKGWRGEDIEVDWLYVLQENFDMARMLRHPKDHDVKVVDILNKLGVHYDGR